MGTKTIWRVRATNGSGTDLMRIDEVDGDCKVYIDEQEITELSGVTATAAELNILDGATVTTAELNYLDITTLGTGAASKAIVLDASGDYTYPATATMTYPSGASVTFQSGASFTAAAGSTFTVDVLNLTANSNQIIMDSDDGSGFTTTVTDSATAARVLTLPDATDTIVGKATTDTFTNKTVNLTSNTLTGTLAQFNTALSDDDFVSLTGAETLTNKTLTTPVISSISNTGTVTLPTATDTLVARATTDTLTNKTIDTANNTITVAEADISDLGSYITASSTDTLTNKTVNLTSNTLTGTTAQFNTALSDNSFATLAGTETLTNKTLTTPIISSISNTGTVTLPTATDTLVARATTDTLTNKTINTASNTITVATGDVTSGTFADARIAESNVTQHEAAIDHDALTNFVANEHIDWTSASSGFSTSGSVTVASINGIDINPGSDTNADLITVGVTGGPKISWNETSDRFDINNDIEVTGDVGGTTIGGITEANLVDKTANETITGDWDFGGAGSLEIPNGAAPTVNAAGEIAIDTTITDHTGLIKYHDGTEELTVIALPTANLTTTDNHVVNYDAANNEFKMEASAGGGGESVKTWVKFDVSGATLDDSFNVDSITDNGVGDHTINITTDFATADYCVVYGGTDSDTGTTVTAQWVMEARDLAAGTCDVLIFGTVSASKIDLATIHVAMFGDQ